MVKALSGTIVRREPGKTVPEEFWQSAIDAGANIWGYACPSGSGQIDWESLNVPPTVDKLMELQKLADNDTLIIYLGHSEESAVDAFNLQPHPVLEDGGDAFILAFIEGDYSTFAGDKMNETAMAQDFIALQIEQFMETTDNDLDRTTELLGKTLTKKQFDNCAVNRGAVTLVCANGEIIEYLKGVDLVKHDWGTSTRAHETAAPVKEPDKPAEPEPAPQQRATSRIKFKAKTDTAAPPAKEPEKVVVQAADDMTKPKVVTEAVIPDQWAKWSHKQKKDWMNSQFGHALKGWKFFKPGAKVTKVGTEPAVQTVKDLKDIPATVAKEEEATPAVSKIRASVPAVSNAKVAFKDHVLARAALQQLAEKGIRTPEQIQAEEEKLPNFEQKYGVPIQACFHLTREDITQIQGEGTEGQEMVTDLLVQYQVAYEKTFKLTEKREQPAATASRIKFKDRRAM